MWHKTLTHSVKQHLLFLFDALPMSWWLWCWCTRLTLIESLNWIWLLLHFCDHDFVGEHALDEKPWQRLLQAKHASRQITNRVKARKEILLIDLNWENHPITGRVLSCCTEEGMSLRWPQTDKNYQCRYVLTFMTIMMVIIIVIMNAGGSCGVWFSVMFVLSVCLSVCLSVFLHRISNAAAARITKLDIEMFHHEF